VTKVTDYGAYVTLDEYKNKEGLIHISEISSTWVRNIRNYVREGQKLVLKVLRINAEKGQVDLSLRRVTGREKAETLLEWKKHKKAEAILNSAIEKLALDPASVENLYKTILEKYGSHYDALQEAVEEGEETFTKLGIDSNWAKVLTEVARSKIKTERAGLKAVVELTCSKPDGIELIRKSLQNAKKAKKPRGTTVRVYAVGAPKYRVEVTAKDYSEAENVLKQVVDEALATITEVGGQGRRVT
jgi:translation initiation factor 2 subunit 1